MKEIDKHLPQLYDDVCHIIEGTRARLAVTVNAEVCWLNWHIGKRIKEDVLYNKRAEYGKEIVKLLADKLTLQYGKGWSDRKLLHCIRAAYTFTENEIKYALRTQLTWTHLRSLIGLILCSEGNTEHIEYLMLEDGNIKVAQYYTQLPDKKILSDKLHKAIAIAKENYNSDK